MYRIAIQAKQQSEDTSNSDKVKNASKNWNKLTNSMLKSNANSENWEKITTSILKRNASASKNWNKLTNSMLKSNANSENWEKLTTSILKKRDENVKQESTSPVLRTKNAVKRIMNQLKEGKVNKIIKNASDRVDMNSQASRPSTAAERSKNVILPIEFPIEVSKHLSTNAILNELKTGKQYENKIKEALRNAGTHDLGECGRDKTFQGKIKKRNQAGKFRQFNKRRKPFHVPPLQIYKDGHKKSTTNDGKKDIQLLITTPSNGSVRIDDILEHVRPIHLPSIEPETENVELHIASEKDKIKNKLDEICNGKAMSNKGRKFKSKRPVISLRKQTKEFGYHGNLDIIREDNINGFKTKPCATNSALKLSTILRLVETSKIFRRLNPADVIQIVSNMDVTEIVAGAKISLHESFCILEEGKVQNCESKIIYPGACWGEEHLFFDSIDEGNNAAIGNNNADKKMPIAIVNCKIWSLAGEIFRSILANESLFQQQNITTFLRNDEYLSQLPIDSMLHCFVHHHYPVNTLFKEGLYLIKKGQVKCTMVRTRINRQVWEMPEERIHKIVHPGEWLGKCFLEEFTDIQTYIVDSPSFLALSDVECYMIDIITLRKYFRGYISSSVASTCIESSPEMEEQSFEIIDPVLKFARRDDQNQGLKDLNLNDCQVRARLAHGKFSSSLAVSYICDENRSKRKKKKIHVRCIFKGGMIEDTKQMENISKKISREKRILSNMKNAFIANLRYYAENTDTVYFGFDATSGGNLRIRALHLKNNVFTSETLKYYIASVVLALTYLHEKDIAHRGISSENIGLDSNGYVKLKGFQNAKTITNACRSFTLCGSPEYMSPEMVAFRGHTTSTDLWSLGIVTYELLYGYFPFKGTSNLETCLQILDGKMERMTESFTTGASRDFIFKSLKHFPALRLGCSWNGVAGITEHVWFAGFNWNGLKNKLLTPPYVPNKDRSIHITNKKKNKLLQYETHFDTYGYKTTIGLKEYVYKEFKTTKDSLNASSFTSDYCSNRYYNKYYSYRNCSQ